MTSYRLSRVLIVMLVWAAKCKGEQNKFDTIVIGMGAAGTVAATTLARSGKNVLALEAQDRIGGRVHTVDFGDGVVEVGAEWVHGTKDSRTYLTALNNSIELKNQDLKISIVQSDGEQASVAVYEIIKKSFDLISVQIDDIGPLGDYLTRELMNYMREKFPDVLEDKTLVTQILALINLMVDNSEAADDWNDLNAADAFVPLDGHQHMSWHRIGYKTFFELLLNKYKNGPGLPLLQIKLNTEVIKIEWPLENEGKVTVTTKDGQLYEAENVIVTVSLGVLKATYKSLFPQTMPQEKITAIEKLQFGSIGKIIFSFPNAWWQYNSDMYGFLWKGDDVKKLNSEDKWMTEIVGAIPSMGSSNVITIWTSGCAAKEVEDMSEDVVKAKGMFLLRTFLGANVTIPEPTGMIRSKWFTNKFTRGTYSYESMIAADYPTVRSDLATPIKDPSGKPRVLFAGEASHPTRFSTVHGAADTGHREAMRLLGIEK